MRIINEDLSMMLPEGTFELFPCNFAIPLNYQVIVNVIRLDANMKKELSLTVQWAVIDAKAKRCFLPRDRN